MFNGDDPLTTYHPDQREISSSNTTIIDPPGQCFRYNKYHPQLLGLILERTTGMSVTEYTQTRLWDPLGTEFGGAWTLDSENSGFEKVQGRAQCAGSGSGPGDALCRRGTFGAAHVVRVGRGIERYGAAHRCQVTKTG